MTEQSHPKLTNRWRLGLSLLLVGHLLAVAVPPLAFQTRGPLGLSEAVDTLFRPIRAYSQFLYLDRGYAFFAPDPGPSHLIQAAISTESETSESETPESETVESETVERMYPDREQQWPRLLYHRHFMITEFLEEIYQPPGPPPELVQLDPQEAEIWMRARARYEHVRQSVIDHLRHENPGRQVAVRRIEHIVPDLGQYRLDPINLTDERLYQVLLDEVILPEDSGELSAPETSRESIPSPEGQPADTRDADAASTNGPQGGDDAGGNEP